MTDNVFLGDELTRWGIVRRATRRERVRTLLHTLLGSAEIDPNALVGSLPLATRQLVEVAKALSRANVKLLILDEPTAALTETEAQVYLQRLRTLRSQGLHIIYITHRLQEVFDIADRVTVLRDGKVVLAGQRVANLDPAAVVTAIAGARVVHPARDILATSAPVLTLEGLGSGTRFGPVDLNVGAGEVVGLFGDSVRGEPNCWRRSLAPAGRPRGGCWSTASRSTRASRRQRWRKALRWSRPTGCGRPCSANSMLSTTSCCRAMRGWRCSASATGRGNGACSPTRRRRMSFPMALAHRRGRQLSGGTQQKLVVGRWLKSANPVCVLMMDEPTQGVDVMTRTELYRIILNSARRDGRAVLFASSDHEEVVALADRAIVMKEGRIVAEFQRDALTEDDLLHAAHLGKSDMASAQPAPPGALHVQ